MVSGLPLLSPSNETIKRRTKIRGEEREGKEGERNEDKIPSLSWHDPQRDPGATLGFAVLLGTAATAPNPLSRGATQVTRSPKGEQILLFPAQQRPKSQDPQGTPGRTSALHTQAFEEVPTTNDLEPNCSRRPSTASTAGNHLSTLNIF